MVEVASAQSRGGAERRSYVSWGRDVPNRNRYFTGRTRELAELRDRLVAGATAVLGQPAQPLYGLGGVGKTEIAAEYAWRFQNDYDLVWWIRAEQEDTILDALVGLGKRMELPDFRLEERDYSAALVLEALSQGVKYDSWLLIFDNAQNPGVVKEYIPQGGPGRHVIITSRDSHWYQVLSVQGLEITEFSTVETVEFLCQRVPALATAVSDPDAHGPEEQATVALENERRHQDATELASELANLPLAAEHAAAYLTETGTTVQEYLDLFRGDAHRLLADQVDMRSLSGTVATTWSVSRRTISPEADMLFQLLAFFSAEPISRDLLLFKKSRIPALPEPLQLILGKSHSSEFLRASRQLARFSLIRIDGARNFIQMHRVVQAVTQSRLRREDPEAAQEFRDAAHVLLAASDPENPDSEKFDSLYELSRPHIIQSGAIDSDDPSVRALIINQVRRLHLRGGYRESLNLGEPTLENWRKRFGANDRQTLEVAVEVSTAIRASGNWRKALELNMDTLQRLRDNYGEEDQVYLNCARGYGISLRMLGRYAEALDHELQLLPVFERAFGADDLSTLATHNNAAISLRCLGRYQEAIEYDRTAFAERERQLGPNDNLTLASKFAIARDLRLLGQYVESLDMIREVNDILEGKNAPWYLFRLLMAADLGVALRRMGYYEDAAKQTEMVYQRHIALVGTGHRQTLQVAINLINDRRLVEDLPTAEQLGEETVRRCAEAIGPEHPNTYAARANLAIVYRVRGKPRAALDLNEHVIAGFRNIFSEGHPNIIVVMTNLASDLAQMGEVRRAREIGEEALELARRVLGIEHPFTLAIASNLSIDRRAAGDVEGARELYKETLAAYDRTLGDEHPEALTAAQSGRVSLNVEPVAG